jgi:hypothetical protein
MNALQELLHALKQPEYGHVLLNPLPVYATAMGVFALAVALLARSQPAQRLGLLIVLIGCVSVWPAMKYGHQGYDRVYAMSKSDAQQWLDVHQQRADQLKYVFYLTSLVALVASLAHWKFPKPATPLTIATLLLAAVCVGSGGWISQAGGKVRHSEFRDGPPATPVEHRQ